MQGKTKSCNTLNKYNKASSLKSASFGGIEFNHVLIDIWCARMLEIQIDGQISMNKLK